MKKLPSVYAPFMQSDDLLSTGSDRPSDEISCASPFLD